MQNKRKTKDNIFHRKVKYNVLTRTDSFKVTVSTLHITADGY